MYKLMIVDDELIIREGIEHIIPKKELGIRLINSCSNAYDALECMVDEMPDILITDIKMPKMDGLELIRRAMELNPLIQVIVLSGYDDFDLARKAIKLGVKEYILKPCDKQELRESLKNLCESIKEIREKRLENMDERNVRIKDMLEQLFVLANNNYSEEELSVYIGDLATAEKYQGVVKEAMARFVMQTPEMDMKSKKQVEIVQGIYEQDSKSIVPFMAKCIHDIYKQKGKNAYINAMREYVKMHYNQENLSLQYVADNVVHMNVDYIGKKFTKECGMKFSQFVLEVRMEHAMELIVGETSLPIYEIAEKVGYGDNQQYFTRMFKKVTGMTPREYRDLCFEN